MPTLTEAWNLYADVTLLNSDERSQRIETGRWKNYIEQIFGSQELSEISNLDIAKFNAHLRKTKSLSPQTVYHILSLIRRIFNNAVKYGIYKGEIPLIEMPKFDNRRQRFLTKSEAENLLFTLNIMSPLWHDISFLALQTGLRAGELLNLTINHVSLGKRLIYIFDSKNKLTRVIPVNEDAYSILEYYKTQHSHYLFVNSLGVPFGQVSPCFRKAVEICQLNKGITDRRLKIVFHSLRHTFASWLVQDGYDLRVVGKLLGHSSTVMTERYAHLSPNQAFAAVNSSALKINYSKR